MRRRSPAVTALRRRLLDAGLTESPTGPLPAPVEHEPAALDLDDTPLRDPDGPDAPHSPLDHPE